MRCLSCNYDLSNLTEHRCPECGRAFDPNNPATYGKPPLVLSLRRMLPIAVLCYILNVAVILWIAIQDTPGDLGISIRMIPLSALVLLPVSFGLGLLVYLVFLILRRHKGLN